MSEELSVLLSSNIEAAFVINGNLKEAQKYLINKLKTEVASLESEFKGYFVNDYVNLDNRYTAFRFQRDEAEYASIAFQFGDYGRYFTYGVATLNDPSEVPFPDSLRIGLQKLTGIDTKEIWWPIKLQFEDPFNKDWFLSYEPWEAIQTGRLKSVIRDKVKYMIELTKDLEL